MHLLPAFSRRRTKARAFLIALGSRSWRTCPSWRRRTPIHPPCPAGWVKPGWPRQPAIRKRPWTCSGTRRSWAMKTSRRWDIPLGSASKRVNELITATIHLPKNVARHDSRLALPAGTASALLRGAHGRRGRGRGLSATIRRENAGN